MGMDWGPHEAREEPSRPTAPQHYAGGPPPPYEQRSFTIGNVIGESFSIYRQFFVHFVSIALAVFVLTSFIAALSTVPNGKAASAVLAIVGLVVGVVGFIFVQAALTFAIDDVRDGRVNLSYSQLFARSRDRALDLFLLGLVIAVSLGVSAAIIAIALAAAGLLWLGIVIDLVLVLFLLTRWAVGTPACVLEDLGPIDALGRSWALTKKRSGRVFGIILLTGLIGGIAGRILTAISSALLSGFLDVWLSSTIANAVITPFLSVAWTLMYFHLRPMPQTNVSPAIPSGAAYTDE